MKKFKNKMVAALAVFTLALGLTGCGNSEKKTETTSAATEVTTEATTEAATETATVVDAATDTSADAVSGTVYPLEVTDSYGNVITIESEPEKVVSVAPNLTEMVYAIDAEDKLVGRSDYCDYPEEVAAIDSVGSITAPDVEKIISLEPDVVIVSTHFEEENADKLEEAGIPVVALYEESEVDGVYDIVSTLGEVVNHNEEAAECVAEMKDTIASVEVAVEGLDAPTVYYVVGYGEYGDYTAGGDTFVGKMLEMAGGDNIAKDISGWSISLEEIIEADPSIIIINESMKDDFVSSPNYSELTAVKEGNVYTLDVNMLERQGYRNAQGILELAQIFHPEAFE